VVLADDHALVREGLSTLLVSASFDVVGVCGDGRELVRLTRAHHPDIVLVDISMPLLNGLEAIRHIRRVSPETKIVVLSMHTNRELVSQARHRGVSGYIFKDTPAATMLEMLHRVANGDQVFPQVDGVEQDDGTNDDIEALTSREREVLQLIVEGRRNAEIADIMMRSLHTVRNHRARIMRKLGVGTAADLITVAERMHLVDLRPPERTT